MLLGRACGLGSLGLFLALATTQPAGCAGQLPAKTAETSISAAAAATAGSRQVGAARPGRNSARAAGSAGRLAAGAAVARTQDSPLRPGFFPTLVRDGHTLLVIPKSRLGRDFLLHAELTQGLAVKELTPGVGLSATNDLLVAFELRDGQVMLVRRQLEVFASEGEGARRAVQAATSDAVLASCPIVAALPEGPAVALDKLLLAGVVPIEQQVEAALRDLLKVKDKSAVDITPQPTLSRLERTVTRPDGVIAHTQQVFAAKIPLDLPGAADPRSLSLRVAYHLTALPAAPLSVRRADERIGFFTIERRDLSRGYEDRAEYFIKRWRLTPGEPVGDLFRPQHPITFYLDPSIPQEFIPAVRDGVLVWNQALEAAGWKDAIAVAPLPAHAEPGDVRRSVIRWVATVGGTRNGQSRQIVDPRTGEVLGARVIIDAASLRNGYEQGRLLLPPDATDRPAGAPGADRDPPAPESLENFENLENLRNRQSGTRSAHQADRCEEALLGGEQLALLHTALLSTGAIGALAPLPTQLIKERLRKTVTHEIGHALGLRHNFRASADIPAARLTDTAWVREHGITSSVMDYPALNLPSSLSALTVDFPFFSPGLGGGDLLAIAYGYSASEAAAERAVKVFSERGFSFATDDEDSAPGAIDPLVNQHDLSDDPLQWGRARAELVRQIVPQLPARLLAQGAQYGELSHAVGRLIAEYFRALAPISKYIGGQYRLRDRVGDPGGRRPFTLVPKDKQRAALALLMDYALSDNPLRLTPQILTQLGGPPTSAPALTLYSDRIDYPVYQRLHGEQRELLIRLLDPLRQQRMVDEEFKFGAAAGLTVAELHEQLTRGVWAEIFAEPRPIPPLRRDLQRAHLEVLGDLLVARGSAASYDAQASARLQLGELLRRVLIASRSAALPLPTRAHLEACAAQVRRLLDPAGSSIGSVGRP